MRKAVFAISLVLIISLSLGLVSASWFSDAWSKITGNAIATGHVVDNTYIGERVDYTRKDGSKFIPTICIDSDFGAYTGNPGFIYLQETHRAGRYAWTVKKVYTDQCEGPSKKITLENGKRINVRTKIREYYCTKEGFKYEIKDAQELGEGYCIPEKISGAYYRGLKDSGKWVSLEESEEELNLTIISPSGVIETSTLPIIINLSVITSKNAVCTGRIYGMRFGVLNSTGSKIHYHPLAISYIPSQGAKYDLSIDCVDFSGKSINASTRLELKKIEQTQVIPETPKTPVYELYCTDTDNGKNYFQAGGVSYRNSSTNPYGSWMPDNCCSFEASKGYICEQIVASGNVLQFLIETYCNGTSLGIEPYYCSNGCKNGACLSNAPVTCDPVKQPYPNYNVVKEECLPSCKTAGGIYCTYGCPSADQRIRSYDYLDTYQCCKSSCYAPTKK